MKINGIPCLSLWMLIILAPFATRINAVESDDTRCLRSIKESLEDPENLLSSWDFNNKTEGFICRFPGVDCWNPDENKVMNIRLSDMGLRGSFPTSLKHCRSISGLDLSYNDISGPIPSDIGDFIPYITSLDLSNNNLAGPIPPTIANCAFLNFLRLENNQLTGQIPPEMSGRNRLVEFRVANNRLSGPVPLFNDNSFPEESYVNNSGLCGRPLNACKHEDHDDLFLSGFAVGFPLFTTLSMLFMFFCSPTPSISNMLSYLLLIKKIEGWLHHLIPRSPQILFEEASDGDERKVKSSLSLSCSCIRSYVFNIRLTTMEKLIRRMSLVELEIATNEFNDKNVIGHGNIGVMYKGGFLNGLLLAVKRLHRFESLEKEFLTEIKILGRLRQTNLVPLLGFCFEMEKKFLVYKYMCNGTLHHWLHHVEVGKMGWALRLKIAVGIARGLAWLHHNNILRVAHLKINSKCILLDENFEPKISNFGDATILMNTSIGTRPSSGYKEDVYSFGILLLELVTGIDLLSRWINSTDYVIDECLMGQGFNEEIHETIRIAENCIHPHIYDATSMLQVYQEMRSIGISRNEISVTIPREEHNEIDYHDLTI